MKILIIDNKNNSYLPKKPSTEIKKNNEKYLNNHPQDSNNKKNKTEIKSPNITKDNIIQDEIKKFTIKMKNIIDNKLNDNLTEINQDLVNKIQNYCYGLLNLNLSPSKVFENLNDFINSQKATLTSKEFYSLLKFIQNIKNKIIDLENHRRIGGNAQNINNQNSHVANINPINKINNSSKNVNTYAQKTSKNYLRQKK